MLNHQARRLLGEISNIHYAWVIIAIAAFMHMAGGSVRQAFGVLVVPLQENMGWSPASVTLGYAMASIVGAVVAPWEVQRIPDEWLEACTAATVGMERWHQLKKAGGIG